MRIRLTRYVAPYIFQHNEAYCIYIVKNIDELSNIFPTSLRLLVMNKDSVLLVRRRRYSTDGIRGGL